MKKTVFHIYFIFLVFNSYAQKDSVGTDTELTLSGFIDVFYAYDFNEPDENYRQPFLFNHNRHNEFNLNLGLINLKANNSRYRADLTLQTGTYANDNYASEPGLLKNIYEAKVGIALNKKADFWLETGVFSSHIGFESAVSMDNLTLTRSLCAENSPYFLSGAKLIYSPNDKTEMAFIVSNGWQRIQRVSGNSIPSFGTQLNYSASEKMIFNWSTFIGTDDPDSTRRMRYFNHFYGRFKFSKSIEIIAGFDAGVQQTDKGSEKYNFWYTPVIIIGYEISEKWATTVRAEYYSDENGVIVPSVSSNGFNTAGFSLNFDYFPSENVKCRLESRIFTSKDDIFEKANGYINNNFFIVGSIAVKMAGRMK